MTYRNDLYMMKAMGRRRSAMVGVLVLGFGGAGMMGACGPSKPGPLAPGVLPPAQPAECMVPIEEPCMRYHIPLLGNPSTDDVLRNKYIAAFGSACYIAAVTNTFDCFYKKWQDACADAVKIGEIYSPMAPYEKGHDCMAVVGTSDYTLQIGSDIANKITINYQTAPPQTSLTEINGVPTAVNGPYRNLPEPQTLGPGQPFKCATVDNNGTPVTQKERILQLNRDAPTHMGKINSDLAGFTWPCDENGSPTTCEEPVVLEEPKDPDFAPASAEVHHVVPMKDKRGCPWGTNSNKNAAVISRKLNQYFSNNDPPADEVDKLNKATAYVP